MAQWQSISLACKRPRFNSHQLKDLAEGDLIDPCLRLAACLNRQYWILWASVLIQYKTSFLCSFSGDLGHIRPFYMSCSAYQLTYGFAKVLANLLKPYMAYPEECT